MAVNRTQGNFKQRNDILGQFTPDVLVRKPWDSGLPAGEWRPAPWLPIQFTKSDIKQGTDYYTISAGKVVAFDTQGYVVPAGLRMAMAGASALTYTATDVQEGVIDLTTGAKVEAAVTYTALEVGKALLARGFVLEQDAVAASATLPLTTNAHGLAIVELFISKPIGVVAYDVYKWGGLAEDGDQQWTNYNKQHLIQFMTEAQMKVPQHVGSAGTDAVDASGLSTQTFSSTNNQVDAGDYWNAANVCQITRYSSVLSSSSPVVAYGLEPGSSGVQYRIAKNTDRTPFTCDDDAVLVRERSSADLIKKAGDWYLDAEAGVLFLHTDTWTYLVGLGTSVTFSFDYYTTTAAGAHRYVHFSDWAKPGDYVTYDAQSNFKVGVPGTDTILGRVLRVEAQPRSLLDKVKTAWNFSGVQATAQMAGSATKGFTDLITLSQETVADRVVILDINIH